MMELKEIAPYAVALIAFLVGYLIRNIEKKTDEALVKGQENETAIKVTEEKQTAQGELNDLAITHLTESMAKFADEFTEYIKETKIINRLVPIHEIKIKNLEDKQNHFVEELRKKVG